MITAEQNDLGSLWLRAAEKYGDTRRFAWTEDGEEIVRSLSFAEMSQTALAIASRLSAIPVVGERVLLLYPPGLDCVAAFGGVALAGAASVPVWPPDPTQLERSLPRFLAVASDAKAVAVLTTSLVLAMKELICEHAPELRALTWIATDEVSPDEGRGFTPVRRQPDDLALIQYTSGSTGQPRGVMLSHANLLLNAEAVTTSCEATASSHVVSWLPQFHDMGLMITVFCPLLAGIQCTMMSPATFVERPLRWLRAITKFKGTHTAGPNFAWELCVRKIPAEALAELDLSSWRVAANGAEPVRARTIAAFIERFGPCGFAAETMCPSYGMAECVVGVAFDRHDRKPSVLTVSAAQLALGQVSLAETGNQLVASGTIAPGFTAAVVNPETRRRCADHEIGELWLRGPCVGLGYWNDDAATEETFRARIAGEEEHTWLATGDLGFIRDNQVLITGRRKDVIIIRGRNLAPHDLEATAEIAHPAVRAGCVAAVRRTHHDGETVALIAEVDPSRLPADPQVPIEAIRASLAKSHAVAPSQVVLIPPRALPKTSSGKLRRREAGEMLARAEFQTLARWEEPSAHKPTTIPALRAWVAERLGVPVERVTEETRLDALGMDSLHRVELLDALSTAVGRQVPADVLIGDLSLGDVLRRADVGMPAPAPVRTEGAVVLPRQRSTLKPVDAPAIIKHVGEETLTCLTGFEVLQAGPLIPQKRMHEMIAYLYAVARCVEEGVKDEGRADAIHEDELRRVAHFGVSDRIVASRSLATMPAAWIPDGAPFDLAESDMFSCLAQNPQGAPLNVRHHIFDRIVQEVAERAFPVTDRPPEAIVHVTTTGYVLPSPVERVVDRRKWLTEVTHSYHQGCHGAMPAIRIGEGLLNSRLQGTRPVERVDVFHSEVNSIHFNPTEREPSDVIGSTLFGDGFVRYSLVNTTRNKPPPGGGLALLAAQQSIIPDSGDDMTWIPGPHNFRVRLSPQVPAKIGQAIEGFVRRLFARAGMDYEKDRDSVVWAFHPGGPKILEAIQRSLNLAPQHMERSLSVLRQYGNMSPATLPTIWSRIVADPAIAPHTRIVTVGFGPGLSAAGMIAEKLA